MKSVCVCVCILAISVHQFASSMRKIFFDIFLPAASGKTSKMPIRKSKTNSMTYLRKKVRIGFNENHFSLHFSATLIDEVLHASSVISKKFIQRCLKIGI